jgi:hypothetical protein
MVAPESSKAKPAWSVRTDHAGFSLALLLALFIDAFIDAFIDTSNARISVFARQRSNKVALIRLNPG